MGPRLSRVVDVVALCAYEYQPDDDEFPGVHVVRARLDDARPSQFELDAAFHAARQVAKNLKQGKVCLVTCYAGLNRSGLISGLSLRMLGYDGETAVRAVRAARGKAALGNQYFRDVVLNWNGR